MNEKEKIVLLKDVPIFIYRSLYRIVDEEHALGIKDSDVKLQGGSYDVFSKEYEDIDIFVSENIYERYYELLKNFKKVEDKKSSKFVRTIAIDFDGVIHSYLSKFVSEEFIPDEPVEGIADLLNKLKDKYKIVIFSTRASTKRGKNAIINYMNDKGLYFDEVTNIKPAAFLYVDDRAIQFNGDCDKLYNDIVSFKRPWNK